jgi:peptidoglycan hydrolase-like protein with peptidoglycan-binding domain
MAKKDTMNLHGFEFATVNLDARVGLRGENRPDDVMLIQTLFRYIAFDSGFSIGRLGLDVTRTLEIDGLCGAVTQRVIRHFQRKNARRLLRVDGVIHPASYKGRVIKDFLKPVMAITLLQAFATDAVIFRDDTDLFTGLVKFEPRLRSSLI